MKHLRAWTLCLSAGLWLTHAPSVHAEDKKQSAQVLEAYMTALEQKKLAPKAEGRVEELSKAVQQAQRAVIEGDKGEARTILLDVVEGPRFRDFSSLDTFHAAELLLASLLSEAHALTTAQRVIDRVLARGPSQGAFLPAYRRAVDIAMARGDMAKAAAHLAGFSRNELPEDAQNELRYVEARAAYDAGALERAREPLTQITKRSRFYANAQYLLGAIAAKQKRYDEAEARFCTITEASKDNAFSFYVDGRFFPVRDLAHLGLGRVAHETGRANDAFYYYFQVPNDSDRLAEAMFEAAWASYEGGDHDAALDSLDQLAARFPRSAHTAEAAVLRGYVHLSRCEFGEAERHLSAFEKQFAPVLREIDATLESASRRASVYADLVARDESLRRKRAANEEGAPSPDSLLLALTTADPEFYKLHSEVASLDAELAQSGDVPRALSAMSARLTSGEAPAPRLDESEELDPVGTTTRRIGELKEAVAALAREIAELGSAGAKRADLAPLRAKQRELDQRIEKLEANLRAAVRGAQASASAPESKELVALLREDQAYVQGVRARAQRVRVDLVEAASIAGERALADVRARLASELRRARIGRVDAVMGSKRQVELQIESLAAGRFPPELFDVLRMQTLLRDDEEYWPFEGEDWPDEFLEIYPDEAEDEP